uniref:Uncharacterized protein n=1 Tax=Setaria digitata TaxID=48799 RepID=A0A915PRQ9_9BILA
MYRPEHLTNQPANSNVSTSVLTQLERCQKRQVVLTPDKTSNKLQTEERTTFYHRCNFRMPDSLEGRTLLEEIRSLSVYKNSDRIILPTRRLGSKSKVQCFYCGEWFDNNENGPGSCKEAPDPAERIIRFLTCYSIAQGAIYHCCKDDDDVPANISRFGQGYSYLMLLSFTGRVLVRNRPHIIIKTHETMAVHGCDIFDGTMLVLLFPGSCNE